jgi:hypothetical protein
MFFCFFFLFIFNPQTGEWKHLAVAWRGPEAQVGVCGCGWVCVSMYVHTRGTGTLCV